MSSLHSNTRGIVSAHICVHTQERCDMREPELERNELWLGEREEEEEDGGGCGGTSWRTQPSKKNPVHSSPRPNPSPTSTQARPPTSGSVTNRAPGSEASAGPWRLQARHCVMWSVAQRPVGIENNPPEDGGGSAGRGVEGREGHGAKSAHTTIWFSTSQFVLMPRGFAVSWLEGKDGRSDSSA